MAGIMKVDVRPSLCRPYCQRIAVQNAQRSSKVHATTCEPSIAATQAEMMKQQQTIIKSLKDSSKRVKKMAKQIAKVPSDQKVALALEMKEMIAKVNSDNDQLLRLVMSMAEAGYEDPDTGSSSDGAAADQVLASEEGGVAQLLKLKNGQVDVCQGKACRRKGSSEQVLLALASHFQDNSNVAVNECSCMGMCKHATNVAMREKDTTNVVCGLQPEMLPEHGVQQPELELVA
eukprot:jgi/Ulvmu1/9310/UM050_0059.1